MATIDATWCVLHIYDSELLIRYALHRAHYQIGSDHSGFLWIVFRILCVNHRYR